MILTLTGNQPDVALNPIYKDIYPFPKIWNANILIMPALHSAAISANLKVFGGGKLIGPLLIGLGSPIDCAIEALLQKF